MTGDTPATLAGIVILPVSAPSVTVVDAWPLASDTDVAGVNGASPAGVTLQETCTPCAGWPSAPRATRLSGKASGAPVGADCESPATPVTEAARVPGPLESPRPIATAANAMSTTGNTRREVFTVLPPAPGYRGTTRYSTSPSRIIPNCSRATRSEEHTS